MTSKLLGAVLLMLALAAGSQASGPPKPTLVFLLAGQSNMQGRGLPLSDGEASSPRLVAWSGDEWRTAVDPLAGRKNGVGPGMSFGLAVARTHPAATVGLIQCSNGGTTVEDWQPAGSLWQTCLAKVRAAGLPVTAVLFLQGESDAETQTLAASWASMFLPLAAAVRADLHAPLVLGQIGSLDAGRYPYQATVRDQQTQAAKQLGLPLVRTLDLPVDPADGTHFTVFSYKTVGERFAAAWAARRSRGGSR